MRTTQSETQSQSRQDNIDEAVRRAWRPLRATLIALLFFTIIMIVLYAIFGWNSGQVDEGLGLLFFYFISIILGPPFSIIFLCFVTLSFSRAIKIYNVATEIKQINNLKKILLADILLGLMLALGIGYSLIVIFSIEKSV